RSPMSWRAGRNVWRSLPKPAPRLKRAPRNVSSGRRPSIAPSLWRGRRRPRPRARSPPVAGGGYDQCYNAQAVVAVESLLVIAVEVVQAPNDKQQVAPMLGKIDALPKDLGRPETLLADNGYFSEANVTLCEAANIEP